MSTVRLKAYIVRLAHLGACVCLRPAASIIVAEAILLAGCSGSNIFTSEIKDNKQPVIELTGGPLEGDTMTAQGRPGARY